MMIIITIIWAHRTTFYKLSLHEIKVFDFIGSSPMCPLLLRLYLELFQEGGVDVEHERTANNRKI